MKWDFNYILKNAKPSFNFDEEITFENDLIKKLNGVYGLNNIKIKGNLKYIDAISQCIIEYSVTGIMEMKCAISNERVDYCFNDNDTLNFTFNSKEESDEIYYAKGNIIDLIPFVWQTIVVNVPLRVVKEGAKYINTSGKSWNIMENENINESKEKPIDPRLESLKNYFDKH